MRIFALAAVLIVTTSLAAAAQSFPITNDTVPGGWSGPVFTPNFDFPPALPEPEVLPWESIDPKTHPDEFMFSVLGYVLEGMDRNTWDGRTNTIRQWYHAPWMHEGRNGREFVHGLTRERPSRVGELGTGQTRCYQNWAVSLVNPTGGYTYGQVWGDGSLPPNPTAATFEVGTVSAKLLFTQAPVNEVPLLEGAPEWEANVESVVAGIADCPSASARSVQTLRLLQFDIAVSVPTSVTTSGWVYGTFVYDSRNGHADPWANLLPVGLMWGNDPGAFSNPSYGPLVESVVLRDFGLNRPFGRDGRMNGPVDNPASACLSCHITAQYPSIAGMAPPNNASDELALCWFRNLKPNEAFGQAPSTNVECGDQTSEPSLALGTSLQLAVGLGTYVRVTGATLSLPPPPELLALESARRELAIRNWLGQQPEDREVALEGPFLDAGRVVFPVSRGD
jgi:hypothetical protein